MKGLVAWRAFYLVSLWFQCILVHSNLWRSDQPAHQRGHSDGLECTGITAARGRRRSNHCGTRSKHRDDSGARFCKRPTPATCSPHAVPPQRRGLGPRGAMLPAARVPVTCCLEATVAPTHAPARPPPIHGGRSDSLPDVAHRSVRTLVRRRTLSQWSSWSSGVCHSDKQWRVNA